MRAYEFLNMFSSSRVRELEREGRHNRCMIKMMHAVLKQESNVECELFTNDDFTTPHDYKGKRVSPTKVVFKLE